MQATFPKERHHLSNPIMLFAASCAGRPEETARNNAALGEKADDNVTITDEMTGPVDVARGSGGEEATDVQRCQVFARSSDAAGHPTSTPSVSLYASSFKKAYPRGDHDWNVFPYNLFFANDDVFYNSVLSHLVLPATTSGPKPEILLPSIDQKRFTTIVHENKSNNHAEDTNLQTENISDNRTPSSLPSETAKDTKSMTTPHTHTPLELIRGAQERALWSQVCQEVLTATRMIRFRDDVIAREAPSVAHFYRSSLTQTGKQESSSNNDNSSSPATGRRLPGKTSAALVEEEARVDRILLRAVSKLAQLGLPQRDATGNAPGSGDSRLPPPQDREGAALAMMRGLQHQGRALHQHWLEKAMRGDDRTGFSEYVDEDTPELRRLLFYRACAVRYGISCVDWAGCQCFLPLNQLSGWRPRPASLLSSNETAVISPGATSTDDEAVTEEYPSTTETAKIEGLLKNARRRRIHVLLSFAPPRHTQAWRYQPALYDDLSEYWRLHREAEARARLKALRNCDAEAFAEHISIIQVGALLQIMERTHDFMRRIGDRLAARAKAKEGAAASPIVATMPITTSLSELSPCAAGAEGAAKAYQRFKAYMRSTNDEFRLVHAVESFVVEAPGTLRATLLPHQMDGLRFLMSLHKNDINGILADEMGVGKTIQTIAFLLQLKEEEEREGRPATSARRPHPHLVLAPLSVVREWADACETFIHPGTFRVAEFFRLDGDDEDDEVEEERGKKPYRTAVEKVYDYDLILLPIHSVRYRQRELCQIQWGYIVVDEAHKAVANLETQTAQSIIQLPFQRRLVLTGTPLSSDLRELWSLLYFLNPDIFDAKDSFDEVFNQPFRTYQCKEVCMTKEHQELLVLRLHQILRPFMLRRTKRDVCKTLKMTHHQLDSPVTAMQAALLQLVREKHRLPFYRQSDEDDSVAGSDAISSSESCSSRGGSVVVEKDNEEEGEEKAHACKRADKAVGLRKDLMGLSCVSVSGSTAQALCNHAFMHPFFSQVLTFGFNRTEHYQELEWWAPGGPAAEDSGTTTTSNGNNNDSNDHAPPNQSPAPPCFYSSRGAGNTVLSSSGKFLMLHLLLHRVVLAKHKVVLFTHWLDCMDLLGDYFLTQGWGNRVEVLSGSTSEMDRKTRVRRFHEDADCTFFVVSMKAGGCGINLQCAHLIVLLDRDYTTTNEDQALARVYRIGQRHVVRAISLATADDAESRVVMRAEIKNKPRQAIIEDGKYIMEGEEEEGAYTTTSGSSGGEGGVEPHEINTSKASSTAASSGLVGVWSHLKERVAERESDALTPSLLSCLAPQSCPQSTRRLSYGAAELCGDQGWGDLHKLISAIDDLVLTDEDKRDRPHLCATLTAARPPKSWEDFKMSWEREEKEEKEEMVQRTASLKAEQEGADDADDDAKRKNSETDGDHVGVAEDDPCAAAAHDPFSAEERRGLSTAVVDGEKIIATTSEEKHAAAVKGCSKAESQLGSAHTWGLFALLIVESIRGPRILREALQLAERSAQERDDPEARKAERDRRWEAKSNSLRLLQLEPPQSFYEKCWDAGMTEEVEIRKCYARELAQRSKRRRTGETTGSMQDPQAVEGTARMCCDSVETPKRTTKGGKWNRAELDSNNDAVTEKAKKECEELQSPNTKATPQSSTPTPGVSESPSPTAKRGRPPLKKMKKEEKADVPHVAKPDASLTPLPTPSPSATSASRKRGRPRCSKV